MPSPQTIEFVLNGRQVCAHGLSVQTTLLDFLRDRGLTGAKEGCAEGECGACTVVMTARHGARSRYCAVNSCLMFLPMAAGQEITTVEALAGGEGGEMAPVQKAMAAAGGSQCGYCTPGFVMSLFAEQYRPDRTGSCDPHQLGGNLCRCTGYRPIRDAALSMGPAPEGRFKDRLSHAAPVFDTLEYEHRGARFSRPGSIGECLAILADNPDARLISGATDMAVESNLRLRRWPHLVSLEAVTGLREFSNGEGRLGAQEIRIGAGLTLTEIAERWTNPPESFRQWTALFASPLIRNRATLAGNLATASPIGDGAPLLLALDASIEIEGGGARRTTPLDGFFTAYRRTLLNSAELIAAITIPKPLPAFSRFYKVAKRRMDDISTVAACFAMDWDSAGRISRARFGFGGVAAIPLRAYEAENAAVGQRWNEAAVERVGAALERTLHPISDHRGSAEYRLEVAKSLVAKFLHDWRESAA